uniref:Uncharacterized protein n=1 Tax=Quercus lobata TaxID=97700 RepID=A0A7N2LPS0_QUELO
MYLPFRHADRQRVASPWPTESVKRVLRTFSSISLRFFLSNSYRGSEKGSDQLLKHLYLVCLLECHLAAPPSTPIAAASASAPGAGTPGLMQGPAQVRYANAPGFVIPAPSFSYSVHASKCSHSFWKLATVSI